MLDEKIIISLSQRLTKKNILSEKEQLNGVFPFIKKKKENNSETHNRSIDFFEKTTTLFNKLEKLKEPKFNNKNIIRNTGKNSDKNTKKNLLSNY